MATKTAERHATQAAPKEAAAGNLPAQQQPRNKPPIVQFREYVELRMATLEDALPPTITPKRFVSVVMTALQNKPKLLECTFPSLWNACVRAAQDGLLPDGREGAIAPYGENKDGKRTAEIATWMPMIEGYRKKIFETGQVKSWQVNVVYEKDDFEFELGDNAFLRHKPHIGADASGGVVGAYSIAKLESGETVREVMSAFQIKQVQDKSKAGSGPWKDAAFFPEMCKKVVARRHYKQLPHSESMDAMIARDDADHGLLDPEATPIARPAQTRRIASREAFDAYAGATDGAGQVIDHDDTTGEVTDDDRSGFQNDDQAQASKTEAKATNSQTTTTAASERSGEAAGKEAGAATKGTNSAPASTAKDEVAGSDTGAGKEAGATIAANDAPASTASEEADLPIDDETADGADRPWPPGAVPSNEAEYERYLDTSLAAMTDARGVPTWWNSQEQKDLRKACNVVRFKELQDKAIARRKELGDQPVR
jgi:recombination protein RecT